MAEVAAGKRRKVFTIEHELLRAVEFLARDRGVGVDAFADEALRDLLKKHGRPVNLKQALRDSARSLPANDRETRARATKPS